MEYKMKENYVMGTTVDDFGKYLDVVFGKGRPSVVKRYSINYGQYFEIQPKAGYVPNFIDEVADEYGLVRFGNFGLIRDVSTSHEELADWRDDPYFIINNPEFAASYMTYLYDANSGEGSIPQNKEYMQGFSEFINKYNSTETWDIYMMLLAFKEKYFPEPENVLTIDLEPVDISKTSASAKREDGSNSKPFFKRILSGKGLRGGTGRKQKDNLSSSEEDSEPGAY